MDLMELAAELRKQADRLEEIERGARPRETGEWWETDVFEVGEDTTADAVIIRKDDPENILAKRVANDLAKGFAAAPDLIRALEAIIFQSSISSAEGDERMMICVLRESLWDGYKALGKAGLKDYI